MFSYIKKLQYPINIKHPNPKAASIIISQYGGPQGELGASLRYLSQRYSMPYPELKGLLTDIGVEEYAPQCYIWEKAPQFIGITVLFLKYLKNCKKGLDKYVFKAYNNICKEVIKHENKRFSKTAWKKRLVFKKKRQLARHIC